MQMHRNVWSTTHDSSTCWKRAVKKMDKILGEFYFHFMGILWMDFSKTRKMLIFVINLKTY